MINLTSRPCQIGSSINTRTQRHGDEDVPACDVPLVGIMLTAEELGELLGDKHAHKAFFDTKGNRKDPMFPQLESFALKHKFENANVRIVVNLLNAEEATLSGAKISKILLTPRAGGLTEMACTVQNTLEDSENVNGLLEHLNRDAQVEIADAEIAKEKPAKAAKAAQQDLPINTFGDKEQPPAH